MKENIILENTEKQSILSIECDKPIKNNIITNIIETVMIMCVDEKKVDECKKTKKCTKCGACKQPKSFSQIGVNGNGMKVILQFPEVQENLEEINHEIKSILSNMMRERLRTI